MCTSRSRPRLPPFHPAVDNIVAPVAACLGDLLTLFILALVGALMVGLTSPLFVGALALGLGAATAVVGVLVTRQQRRERAKERARVLRRREHKEEREQVGTSGAVELEQMAEGGWGPLVRLGEWSAISHE